MTGLLYLYLITVLTYINVETNSQYSLSAYVNQNGTVNNMHTLTLNKGWDSLKRRRGGGSSGSDNDEVGDGDSNHVESHRREVPHFVISLMIFSIIMNCM